MSEPLVQCRPRTNLVLIPDVLTQTNVVLDPQDNLPVIGVFLNVQRHVLQPNFESPLCPGNKDGVIVVVDRSKNVRSATVNYVRPDLTEIKVVPIDRVKPFDVFIRVKFQQDKAETGKDKPRRATFRQLFSIPAAGTAVQAQTTPVNE